jgi:hypothetical protein
MTCKSLCSHPPNWLHIHTEPGKKICNAVTKRTNIPNAWKSCCFMADSSPIPVRPRWLQWLKCPMVFSDSWTATETVASHYGLLLLRPFETFYNYAVSFSRQPPPPGVYIFFKKIHEKPQNSTAQNCVVKQVPHSRPTNIRRHRTKFSSRWDLTTRICAPMLYFLQPHRLHLYLWQKRCTILRTHHSIQDLKKNWTCVLAFVNSKLD